MTSPGNKGVAVYGRQPIPVSVGKWVFLEAQFPMTPEDWDRMMVLLEVMKPGLVAESLEPEAASRMLGVREANTYGRL